MERNKEQWVAVSREKEREITKWKSCPHFTTNKHNHKFTDQLFNSQSSSVKKKNTAIAQTIKYKRMVWRKSIREYLYIYIERENKYLKLGWWSSERPAPAAWSVGQWPVVVVDAWLFLSISHTLSSRLVCSFFSFSFSFFNLELG